MIKDGKTTSERAACYHAFYAGLIVGLAGIYFNADLTALGVLIGSITLPLMWYAGMRTGLKVKKEKE